MLDWQLDIVRVLSLTDSLKFGVAVAALAPCEVRYAIFTCCPLGHEHRPSNLFFQGVPSCLSCTERAP